MKPVLTTVYCAETRNRIFEYLHDEPQRRDWFYQTKIAQPDAQQARNYANLTHVCRQLRTEFMSVFLSTVLFDVPVDRVELFVQCFSGYLEKNNDNNEPLIQFSVTPPSSHSCPCETDTHEEVYDLRPLLLLACGAPQLVKDITLFCKCFSPDCSFQRIRDSCLKKDLDTFIWLSHNNKFWTQELGTKIASIRFTPFNRFATPSSLQRDDPGPNCLGEPCIEIVYRKECEPWPARADSFDAFKVYLERTDLEEVKALGVRIRLT